MSHTLKVRDRTTNKVRDALVDAEDYARLKDFKYLTDKNSKEPFRETTLDGKRPRIALKRDVMNFSLGDPRRVCYIDKDNVFDCRKVNLKTKADTVAPVKDKVVKMVKKTVNVSAAEPKKETVVLEPLDTEVLAPVVAQEIAAEATVSKLPVNDSAEFKRTLMSQINPDKLLEIVPLEALLAAWAETHGYQKKQA